MSHLRSFASKRDLTARNISPAEVFSIYYHNIFEYPLTFLELIRWLPLNPPRMDAEVDCKNGFYFIKNNESFVYRRLVKKRISKRKSIIAANAAKVIGLLRSVRMVGITGSLAMENANKESDIDLVVITKKGKLWSTRLASYLLLKIAGQPIRKPGKKEHGELCLNMWLDESNLKWRKNDRNFYTAHEILQIIPLVNKDNAYARFLKENSWVFGYWPHAHDGKLINGNFVRWEKTKINMFEDIFFKMQVAYMRKKMTNEIVNPTRAIFHPTRLSNSILGKLGLDKDSKTF